MLPLRLCVTPCERLGWNPAIPAEAPPLPYARLAALEHVAGRPCGHKDGDGGALSLVASLPLGLSLLSSAPAMAMVVLVGDSPRLWGHRRLDRGTPYQDMASNSGLEALPGRSARGGFFGRFCTGGSSRWCGPRWAPGCCCRRPAVRQRASGFVAPTVVRFGGQIRAGHGMQGQCRLAPSPAATALGSWLAATMAPVDCVAWRSGWHGAGGGC